MIKPTGSGLYTGIPVNRIPIKVDGTTAIDKLINMKKIFLFGFLLFLAKSSLKFAFSKMNLFFCLWEQRTKFKFIEFCRIAHFV